MRLRQPRQFGRRLPAAAVAGVWLYHGLWCKLLARCPEQRDIVATVPFLPRRLTKPALVALGLVEVVFAGWVISGRRPLLAASAQTALLAGMNGGGLAWGRTHIPAPKALVAENAAFTALVWWAAQNDREGE
jgi:DoxX-like family